MRAWLQAEGVLGTWSPGYRGLAGEQGLPSSLWVDLMLQIPSPGASVLLFGTSPPRGSQGKGLFPGKEFRGWEKGCNLVGGT